MLIIIYCGWCEMFFFVCRSCWRGQAYCCSECRLLAKRMQRRRAQRKYRSTEKGRRTRREAERRRRLRRNGDGVDGPGAVSEKIPLWLAAAFLLLKNAAGKNRGRGEKAARCLFRGARGPIVEAFPARGYGTTAAACGAG